MNTDIIKINPSEFGLTDETAKNIQQQFQPMLDKMVELEKEFNEVVKIPIDSIHAAKKARELRLQYVKVRTGTAEIHKTQKAFYLNGGRFVDGWKNAQLFASQGKEEKLEQIEKHREIQEAKAKAELKAKRIELLCGLVDNPDMFPVADMTEDAFNALIEGQKLALEAKKAAEAKAEADRLAAIKAEKDRIEAQRIENEKLKADAEKREKEIEAERKKQADILAKQKAEAEKAMKAEAEKREKIEKELQSQKAQAAKIEADRLAKQKADELEAKKAANAPDKVKLKNWVYQMSAPLIEVNSPDAIVVANEIQSKFESFKNWALTQIDTIQ